MTNSWSGYTGSVDHVEDAIRAPYQGSTFPIVATAEALKVTANTAGTLSANVAGGISWAYQVKATLDPTSVSFDAVTSAGLTRWDAVVVRRNWSTKTVGVFVVPGVAAANAAQLVPTLASQPGAVHEQLLALVQISYGSTVPTMVSDRRLWAHKTIYALDLAALPAPDSRYFGLQVTLASGARYIGGFDTSNAPAWVPVGGGYIELTQSDVLQSESGWSGAGMSIRGLHTPYTGEVQVEVQERRSGPSIVASSVGNFADTPVCTLKAPFRPQQKIPVCGQYAGGGGGWAAFTGVLEPSGLFTLQSGMPFLDLLNQPPTGPGGTVSASDMSLRALIRFTRKV